MSMYTNAEIHIYGEKSQFCVHFWYFYLIVYGLANIYLVIYTSVSSIVIYLLFLLLVYRLRTQAAANICVNNSFFFLCTSIIHTTIECEKKWRWRSQNHGSCSLPHIAIFAINAYIQIHSKQEINALEKSIDFKNIMVVNLRIYDIF